MLFNESFESSYIELELLFLEVKIFSQNVNFFINFEKPGTSAALDVSLLALLHTIYKTTGRKEKTIVLVSLARPTRPISLLKK